LSGRSRAIVVSFESALASGEPPPGNLAVPIFAHGSLEAEFYAPRGSDRQKPHSRDEVYIVASGEGLFFDGNVRHTVQRGSFVFVPAGQEHRFEEFTLISRSGYSSTVQKVGRLTVCQAPNKQAADRDKSARARRKCVISLCTCAARLAAARGR
jgi:cupin domain